MDAPEDDVTHRTKVARLIQKYDLGNFGAELERMWTASGDERRSLRELSTIFNRRILRSAVEDVDVNTISNDMDDIYLRLQGEKGTVADQTRVRRQLEREGVDVDTLLSDFVTYQAIRTFLKEERDAEYDPDTDPIKRDRESLQQLRNRAIRVTETKLKGLDKSDHIELGSPQITVDINVFCEDCGRQFDVTDILDQEGCECEPQH